MIGNVKCANSELGIRNSELCREHICLYAAGRLDPSALVGVMGGVNMTILYIE